MLGIAITCSLGIWQMNRAAQKLALQAAIERQRERPPIDATALLAPPPDSQLHRAVVLRGTWLARHTVFLDNRQMRAKAGFYVVTPLQLEGSGVPVLVERGWAPRNFLDRTKVPGIATPGGVVEVRGRVAPPPSKLYEFTGAETGLIRQNLDLPAFRAETGLALPALAVQQSGEASDGLLRDWPLPATGVEKHYGYAFQWGAMAVLIAILYAWFQFIAPRRKGRLA